MIQKIIAVGVLSFAFAIDARAHDGDRINQIEKELQDVKLRLLKLESPQGEPSRAPEAMTSGDGWKSVANWRKLASGMNASDVRRILGEPQRINGGNVAQWYYQNRGVVIFLDEKVRQWEEPRLDQLIIKP